MTLVFHSPIFTMQKYKKNQIERRFTSEYTRCDEISILVYKCTTDCVFQDSISQLRLPLFRKTFIREASSLELIRILPFEQRFPLLGEIHLHLYLLNQAVPEDNHKTSGKS